MSYYQKDKRTILPQPIKRFVVGAWDNVEDYAHSKPADASVLVLAPTEESAQDTIRQLRPNFEAFETREAVTGDEDTSLLLYDFRQKYNTP